MPLAKAALCLAALAAAWAPDHSEDAGGPWLEPALDADDECAGPQGCNLGALQLKAHSTASPVLQSPVLLQDAKPALLTGCGDGETDVKCPARRKCVTWAEGNWSQCIDCTTKSFRRDCQKLSRPMRHAAVQACRKTCLDTHCMDDTWCIKPYKCVKGKGKLRNWSQCIMCSKKFFTYKCNAWAKGFRKAAEHRCHRKCKR